MNQHLKQYVKVILNLLIALCVLLCIMVLLPKVLIFFMPFVIGWIIALIANPPVKFLEEKLKIKRKPVTAFVIIAVLSVVIFLGYIIVLNLVQQVIGFVHSLPDLWKGMEADFQSIGSSWDIFFQKLPKQARDSIGSMSENLSQYMGEFAGKISTPTMEAIGNIAKNIPLIIISTIMCILSAYFFVAEKEYVSKAFHTYMPKSFLKRWDICRSSLRQALGGYFLAQFKIEGWIYILVVIGLMILGVEYAFLIAIGIAILDFFPFFGTGTVMVPWAIIKFLTGDYKMMIGLLVIWGVGQLVRQFIQPKIVGDSIGLKPIPTLFLLFIGYRFGSVLGMIIAVPVGIIFINLGKAGVFDTTRDSVRILAVKLNRFRRLDKEDYKLLELDEEMKASDTEDNISDKKKDKK